MSKQLVEMFAEIVAATKTEILTDLQTVDPNIQTLHYEHGHYAEINQTLVEFNNSKTYYNQKYPLVALLEDVPLTVRDGIQEGRFTIVICYSTKSDIKSQERYDEVINPILEPIYQELLRQIDLSGYFFGYTLNHTKIIHPYYGAGTLTDTKANIFSDYLDCIELRDVRLKVYPQDECAYTN